MSPTLKSFVEFQSQLVEKLEAIPDVLGLMFAGSSADLSRVDEYSDQDFFLIVANGKAEEFRQNLAWLPSHDQITLAPRETDHGLKVLYRDGNLLEFAVFEIGELPTHTAPVDNRVVFDRGGVEEIIKRITHIENRAFDPSREYQLFLTLIQIGVGRVMRGEVIAGSQHIKSYALNHLLGLIRHYLPSPKTSEDALNRYRRFEFDYQELGGKLAQLVEGESLACAKGLLVIAQDLPISKDFTEATIQVKSFLNA
jgi:hypothetical protein